MSASKFAPIVLLHPEDTHFPMHPREFISQSRFRHHITWGRDEGYNKNAKDWIKTNARTPREHYYDIPVEFINSYGLQNGKNRRPRDKNNGDKWNVFLQPDGNPVGISEPNGEVPVFYCQKVQDDGKVFHQYWFFFGYNPSLALRHQGDWEDFTAVTQDNRLVEAYFSAHGDRRIVTLQELELEGEQVKVYCAKGSHALYPRAGSFASNDILRALGWETDKTATGGYKWNTSRNMELLSEQPWKDYAGAWGEVGNINATTGPLGPWYKRWGT